jgi:hypothetical protein
MYVQPVENSRRSPAAARATAPQPSQRTLRWARVRELGEAIIAGGDDPASIAEQARELVGVLQRLEEWDGRPAALRPIPMVALSHHHVELIYSLVLLALVQKTGSAADRPGEPRYSDVRDRWLEATAEELEEVRARLAEVWARGSGRRSSSGRRGGSGEDAAAACGEHV